MNILDGNECYKKIELLPKVEQRQIFVGSLFEYNENIKGLQLCCGGRSAFISKSDFFICLYGREGDRWGGSVSHFELLGLGSDSFSLFPIHLNGRPRSNNYHLLIGPKMVYSMISQKVVDGFRQNLVDRLGV